MSRDWWILIRFVCFMLQGLLLCDRPVSGNIRLHACKFASQTPDFCDLCYFCHLQE